MEKLGIPTVTIVTEPYEDLAREAMVRNGVADMALVVVSHPVAGLSDSQIREKVDGSFPEILETATEWQPASR